MKSTAFDVSCCEECKFFWTDYTRKLGQIPHCNFYETRIKYKFRYSAKEKHPDCKVARITVNEE